MIRIFTLYLAKAHKARNYIALLTGLMITLAGAYVWATVVVPSQSVSVSSDKAANGPSPAYTQLDPIKITEGNYKDLKTGSLTLTAPTGWQFNPASPRATSSNTNVIIGTTDASNSTITINYSVINANQGGIDEIIISGVQIRANDGNILPNTGEVRLTSSVFIPGLPTTAAVLNQTIGSANKLAFSTQPGNAEVGSNLNPQPSVLIQDFFGRTITNATNSITLSIGTNPPTNGVLSGNKTVAAVNGVATFTDLNIDVAGAGYTLAANSGTLTNATSNAFTIYNKKPVITQVTPCLSANEEAINITVSGNNIVSGATAYVGSTASANARTTTYNTNGTLSVRLLASDLSEAGSLNLFVVNPTPATGNGASDPFQVTVYPVLTADDISGLAEVCPAIDNTYTAPEGFSAPQWTSSAGGSVISGTNSSTATVRFDGTQASVTLTFKATNACGLQTSTTKTVTVNPLPTVSVSTPEADANICKGESISLDADGADSYTWSPATGLSSTTGTSVTASPTATTTYTVTGTNTATGCKNTAQITVTVDPTSVGGTIDPLTTSVCTGSGTVLELKNHIGTVIKWQSTTNNADPASWTDIENSATKTSLSTGVLTTATYFRAVVQSGTCAADYSDVATVTIDEPSNGGTASATEETASICAGSKATVELIGHNGNIVRWEQKINGGSWTTISSTANPYVTEPLSANTSFRAVVKNGACAEVTSSEALVTVDQSAKGGTAQAKTSPICSGKTAEISLNGQAGTIIGWQKRTEGSTNWADITSTANPYISEELTATTYFRAVVENGGCTDFSSEAKVSVTPTVGTPSITGTPITERCQGTGTTDLDATATDATGYSWRISPTTAGTIDAATGVVSWAEGFSGDATIYVAALGCNGPSTEDSHTINVTPTVGTPSFTDSPATTRCQGAEIIDYNASATDATGYSWRISPTTAGTIDAATGVVSWAEGFSGDATIYVAALGCNGPSTEDSHTIKVTPTVGTPSITGTPITERCQGTGTTDLDATATDATGYSWRISPTTAGTVDASGVVSWAEGFSGNATIYVAALGCNGPSTEDSHTIKVTPTVGTPSFTDSPATTRCQGAEIIDYNASATDATGYSWRISPTTAGTVDAASGEVSWAAGFSGNATIYVKAEGCNGPSDEVAHTVSVTPTVGPVTITGDTRRCSGAGTTTYEASATDATGYSWRIDPAAAGTLSATTGSSVTVTWDPSFGSGSGVDAKIIVEASGLCSSTSTDTHTTRAVTSPVANAGENQSICIDTDGVTDFNLNGTATPNWAADKYVWSKVSEAATITSAKIINPNDPKSAVEVVGYGQVTFRLTTTRTDVTPNCETSHDVTYTFDQRPDVPAITNIKSTYYTGEGETTLTGSPTPTDGSTFTITPAGSTTSTNLARGSFNPCSFTAGDYVIRYTYKDSSTGCTNFVEHSITIKQSTYTVVISADPFTICRGQKTNYTAKVYRDAEVIYPYLEDPASIVQPNIETTYNPAYDPYLPADVDSIHFDYAARFFQPVVVSGTLVPADEFSYQWTKNDEQDISKDANVFNQAGLSSTDYYRVRVTQKSSKACITTITDQKSNPLFIADPAGYAAAVLANTNPICQGDNTLQFTASLGEFDWVKANAQYRWMLKRGENIYPIGNLFSAPGTAADLTLTAAEINAALSAIPVEPAEVINDDLVYLEFSSDIESIYSGKCQAKPQSSADPIIVNDIDAEAPDQSTTICAGSSTTFTVTANATGTGQVNYNWLVTDESSNETTYSTTNPDLEIGASLPAGEYKLSVNVSITIEGATAPCEVNSLPLGTLTIRDIVAQTLSGGGTYCEIDPVAQEISLRGVQDNINYSLVFTPANGGEPQTIETLTSANATAEGVLNFTSQTAAGNYEVKASFGDTPQCTESMGSTTITITEATELQGEIEVWGVEGDEEPEMWELRAVDITPAAVTGTTYYWYVGESKEGAPVPADGWIPMDTTTVPTYQVEAPKAPTSENIRYRVIVNSPDDECIKDLVLEIQEPVDVLPVIMLYFNAEVQQDNVVLRWATGQEQNNTGFEVQLSTNGTTYRTLAFVETENGNSSAIQTYNYTDTEYGKHSIRYYRLKQIDVDGQFEFFGPVRADFGSRNTITVSPNPFIDELGVSIETEAAGLAYITLTNTLGIQLLKRSIAVEKGVNLEELQINSALPGGIYYITIQVGDITKQYKVLKHE